MNTEGTVTIYQDANGWWRWQIKAKNGRIIGASTESYWKRGRAIGNLWAVTGRVVTPMPREKAPIVRNFGIRC